MSDELSAEELERLRKMTALGKVSLGIVLKWTWLFAVVFLVLFAGVSWYMIQRSARSDWRYTATSRLMYMPFQGTKVPAMGDKQLFRGQAAVPGAGPAVAQSARGGGASAPAG